ncbi:MAG: Cof-type HAD-IIB family hydrolase [Streptococcaceae bacterium]|jgi:Cof subfamily protein (haloacid dehalogenase superfamily)|nr:Cof-type HAD-IIB family hydrolase [Streptococcaceae bacterium]
MKEIVLDIDGTLLNSDKVITPKTKSALIEAQESGIKVILASGRSTNGMLKFAKELQMAQYDGLLVAYNGARVTDVQTGEVLFDQSIPKGLAQSVLEKLKSYDLIPMINDDQYMYVNNVFGGMIDVFGKQANIIEYESRGGNFLLCEQEDLAKFADFPLNKILVAGEADYLQAVADEIYAPFKAHLTGAFSAPFYFEFTAKGIDKAKALDVVNTRLGIEAKDVISFGDAQNDATIINYAGLGVVMGNGTEAMKASADFVTSSHDEDGIAVALAKFL